jgi:hypothetical protein
MTKVKIIFNFNIVTSTESKDLLMQHADGWMDRRTDVIFPVCALFLHVVQGTHDRPQTDILHQTAKLWSTCLKK